MRWDRGGKMENLTKKTEEELEAIIRRAENTNVSGSLFQRAKIEIELRDRKKSENIADTIKIGELLDKRIKRGRESWNFFYFSFGVPLAISAFVIKILPIAWIYQLIIFVFFLIFLIWLCFINAWWQNKLIGLKISLEDTWKKL